MINIALEENEARLIMMDLNTIRKMIYKEGSAYWLMSKKIEENIRTSMEKEKEEQ